MGKKRSDGRAGVLPVSRMAGTFLLNWGGFK